MKIRLVITLVLVLLVGGVNPFGLACETSCELGSASGSHHHGDVANAPDAPSMDPMMAMPVASSQAQVDTIGAHLLNGISHSACPLSHTQCLLDHLSANRAVPAYQILPMSELPALDALACNLVIARPLGKSTNMQPKIIFRTATILRI